MPLVVMILVLFAACLHATWNFMVKSGEDKYLGMSAVVVGHIPFAAAALVYAPLPSLDSLPYILAGAVLHVGYQLFLLASYRSGDLSQVYPLARGVAPLFVAGISITLLGQHLSWLELAAVITIGTGIMSLAAVRRSDGMRNYRAASLAIITGGFIASYSLVDGLGARIAGTALGYYSSLSMINAATFAVIMEVVRPGVVKRLVVREWRLALGSGGASFLAYSLVVWAFTLAPIALVCALRETSIIFALMLGVVVLRERIDHMKIAATLITILGVILLRING